MKHLLISLDPRLCGALQVALGLSTADVLLASPTDHWDEGVSPPFLTRAIYLHAPRVDAHVVSLVTRARTQGYTPVFVLCNEFAPEWQEKAYCAGAQHVFTLPLRAVLLQALLDRHPAPLPPAPLPLPAPEREVGGGSRLSVLANLREFSRLLGHSLNATEFAHLYLGRVRELLRVNRYALFLRENDDALLRCVSSAGIDPSVAQNVCLSLERGLGAHLRQTGVAAFRHSLPPERAELAREFDLFGVHLAIPVHDRSRFFGLLLLGPQVSGQPLPTEDVDALFVLAEELAAGLRNAQLHQSVAQERGFLDAVLSQMSVGCLIVDGSLAVLRANATALACCGVPPGEALTFQGIPPAIASLIFQVSNGTMPRAETVYVSPANETYRIAMQVLTGPGLKPTVLVLAENCTVLMQRHADALTASQASLLARMGTGLAHELRNALARINTYAQLLPLRRDDPAFVQELAEILPPDLLRLVRRTDQLFWLATDMAEGGTEPLYLVQLVQETWSKVSAALGSSAPPVLGPEPSTSICVLANRAALAFGLYEILLNAGQQGGSPAQVRLVVREEEGAAVIEVHDSGAPPDSDTRHQAFDPFFTTRAAGLGLGLTVALRLIHAAKGTVTLGASKIDAGGVCTVRLPLLNP